MHKSGNELRVLDSEFPPPGYPIHTLPNSLRITEVQSDLLQIRRKFLTQPVQLGYSFREGIRLRTHAIEFILPLLDAGKTFFSETGGTLLLGLISGNCIVAWEMNIYMLYTSSGGYLLEK